MAPRATWKPRSTQRAPICPRRCAPIPTYHKFNPADAPILILALTSDSLSPGQIYDSASNILQQKLSQVQGVGQVQIGGSSLPAVRVELNPRALFKYGIGLEDLRAALSAANANAPKGAIDQGMKKYEIDVNDQASTAAQFAPLIVAYRNNAAVRLSDVATVSDGVEDLRNIGIANGKPAILVILYRQPGANIISTVDNVKAVLPQLQAALPPSVKLIIANDRTGTIRNSLRDVERTMTISVILVIFVVYLFLRNGRAAIIPSIAVPLSLVGTFGVMYMLNYTLDNLSLMALTVATGFVVDDAIVVLENVTRHIEAGMPRMEAVVLGAQEVGFTVLSMSLSLISVFLPILLMGGIIRPLLPGIRGDAGHRHRDVADRFAHHHAHAVQRVRSAQTEKAELPFARIGTRSSTGACALYQRSLAWTLDNPGIIVLVLVITIALNFYLFIIVPKGLFPDEDTGEMFGSIRADQSISFQAMKKKFSTFVKVITKDPAVESVVGFTGGGGGGGRGNSTNSARVFVQLKPVDQRPGVTTDDVARAAGEEARLHRGRTALPARRAGYPRRRPAGQRRVSIHAASRHAGRIERVGAQDHQRVAERAGTGRRQFRPAGQRP